MRTGGVNWRLSLAGAFLAAAILFGGGGTPSPQTELVVELAALLAVVVWTWLAARGRSCEDVVDWPLFIVGGIVLAIPIGQLIPLPPALWHHLPGRGTEVRALALVGQDEAWMPLSLSPARTLASLLSLVPPLAMLFMTSRLRDHDRIRLIGILGGLGLLAGVVGVLQLVSGNANWLRFYAYTSYGFATGFQANRNADADILLITTMALVCWACANGRVYRLRQFKWLLSAVAIFLALSVVLTGSRTGVALIGVVLLAVIAMAFRSVLSRNRRVAAVVIIALLVIVGAGYALSGNARVQRTLARFDDLDAVRPEIWKDTIFAIREYWPTGTGVGTFQPVFAAAERLEFVRPEFSNRAHNDYLEFLLEVGFIAPILLVLIVAFTLIRITRMMRSRGSNRPTVGILVLGSFLVLTLHSLVDYPERSLSLAVVTGMLGGLLGRIVGGRGGSGVSREVAG